MNAVLNFLKSLVFPTRMIKYRYMTVFISILIFVLSSSILSLPTSHVYNRDKYEWIEESNTLLLQHLTNMPMVDNENSNVNEIMTQFKSKDYKVVQNNSTYDLISSDVEKQENGERVFREQYDMFYTNEDGKKVNIHIIVDMFDKIKDKDLTGENKEKIRVEIFDEEPYIATENEDHVIILLYTDALYYRVNAKVKNETNGELEDYKQHSKAFWSAKYTFDTDNLGDNAKSAGTYLSHLVMDGYIATLTTFNSFLTFIYCVIYPLIIVLLFWLMFRRNGRLKTFKEYYNIAAISSIVTVAVMFVLLWFLPSIGQYFIFVFAAFYLYQLMKINSMPELV